MLLYMGSGTALAEYHRNRRIQALVDCARICDETARHCLERLGLGTAGEGREVPARIHALATGCHEFCTLTATLMTRDSALAPCIFSACSRACRACAEACEPGDDREGLRECSRACRRCEEICRELSGDPYQDTPA